MEAAWIQSRAAAISSGGVRLRVPGLNAQANRARDRTCGSGAPRWWRVRAGVMVVRASATDRREVGASCGHFMPV